MIGPVFAREVATIPRRSRFYVARTTYVGSLLILMCTAWMIVTGTQNVRNLGDIARFGASLFQLLAPLQLGLVMIFSALLAASAVAQEKDRRTLILLLLTNLSNREVVLGKLLASLLNVLVMLAGALPLFLLSALLGGVAISQIGQVFAVTLATALVAGSLGSTIALWREKTFQTLAITALVLVAWLSFWEVVAAGAFGTAWAGYSAIAIAQSMSPWRAILMATQGTIRLEGPSSLLGNAQGAFLLTSCVAAILLNAIAILKVRVWNPSREVRRRKTEADSQEAIWSAELVPSVDETPVDETPVAERGQPRMKTRRVWSNPVLWREIGTWAYGRKVLLVRFGYLLLFAAAAWALGASIPVAGGPVLAAQIVPAVAKPLIPLFLVSLVLLNALAVTSITNERDSLTLDLLLVTDLSAREIIFGKLLGVFYNTKEMIILPLLLCVYLGYRGGISLENLFYLIGGLLVMVCFACVLGIHLGMSYANSRSAIGASLGTLLFLFIGVATCMRMMIAFSGSFHTQLQPFLAFMIGGGAGLFATLGLRNPSRALLIASFLAPPATFYAITSFLLDSPLAVFFVVTGTYGFATAAMLIPALHEFDVATGRVGGENE